jgi:hypothetical protein
MCYKKVDAIRTCYFGHITSRNLSISLWIVNLIDASNDKKAPTYTITPFRMSPPSKNNLASKNNQIAAPKKVTEDINSPIDLLRCAIVLSSTSKFRTKFIKQKIGRYIWIFEDWVCATLQLKHIS